MIPAHRQSLVSIPENIDAVHFPDCTISQGTSNAPSQGFDYGPLTPSIIKDSKGERETRYARRQEFLLAPSIICKLRTAAAPGRATLHGVADVRWRGDIDPFDAM